MSSPDPISRDETSALDALHACFTALADGRLEDAGAFPAEVLAEARALLLRHEAIERQSKAEASGTLESTEASDATTTRGTTGTEHAPTTAAPSRSASAGDDAARRHGSGTIAAGTRIGAFTVQEFLGHGATGEVYRATQHAPSREVALKVLLPEFAGGSDLHREAETLANLEHPSIARLYQTGEARMGPLRRRWIAMQYVPGRRTLADWAAERARASGPDARACVPMMIAIADAVAFAHGRGVIHRDLKPGNILVDPEARPVLIDFGVARLLSVDTQQTLHALGPRVVGTLAYAAPESLDARTPPDVRVDVFALGAILYELLAHEPFRSFRAHDLGGMLAEALSGASNHRVGATSRPGLRGDLDRIVAKATATDPAARYASVSQFADDLRRHLAGEPVLAELQTPVERWLRAIRRHRRTVAAATAAVGLLLTTTAVSLAFARDARAKARLAHLSAAARALQDADLMLVSQHAQALGAHDGTLERDVLERAGALRGTTVAEGDWYSIACDARADRIYAFGYPVPYVSRPVVAGFRRVQSPGDRASWTMEWSHPSLDTATNCIALSPDGTRLAAFDAGGALVVLDARDGRVLGGNGAPEAVPNGLSVAIASDGTIAAARDVLDLRPIDEPGRLIARVDPAIGTIRAIAFNPIDPTTLVAVGHAGAVLLARDGARVDVVTRFEVPDSFQSAAVWTPDGRHLAMSGRDRTVRLYSPDAAKPLWTAHGHRDSVWTLAIDAHGGVDGAARVLSAGADGTLRAWRLSDGAPMAATPLSDDIVWSIARTEEGTLVAGTQGALAISDGARIEAWMGRGPAEPFARTGRALRIEPGARARLVEVDGGRERPLPEIPGAGAVSRVAISPDDARVLLLREDGTISLVDVAAATVRWSTTALRREDVHEPNGIPSLALDAVDARAIVASRPFGCTALSARDGAILWKVPVGASCTDVAVSHDGARVFAADRDGLVESLDARDGTPIASSRRQRTRTSCMAVSADGSRLVTGGTDGTLRILDARTLEEQLNILLSPEQLRSVWIADDGIHAVDRAGIERVR